MASDVSTLYAYAVELLGVTNAALATTDAGAIDRAFVSPTLPALDCCPQLTVDVRTLGTDLTSPTTPIPALGHKVSGPSSALIIATLAITVVRCTPTVEENSLPSVTAMQAAARATSQDLWAIWNAIFTLARAGELFGGKCPALYLDPPVPLNAEGGCVGWVIGVRPAINGYSVTLPS